MRETKLPPKILVIEHDNILNNKISNFIERSWCYAIRSSGIEDALEKIEFNKIQMAIISSRIQDASPIEAAAMIRKKIKNEKLPIILLIEETEQGQNYIVSLKQNCHIVKRSEQYDVLIRQIKKILSRHTHELEDRIIEYSNLKLDLQDYKLYISGQPVRITPTNFKILQLMVQNPQNIYSRKEIMDFVWGKDRQIEDRTVDVHINRIRRVLRNKVKSDSGDYYQNYDIIRTIRDTGYVVI